LKSLILANIVLKLEQVYSLILKVRKRKCSNNSGI